MSHLGDYAQVHLLGLVMTTKQALSTFSPAVLQQCLSNATKRPNFYVQKLKTLLIPQKPKPEQNGTESVDGGMGWEVKS